MSSELSNRLNEADLVLSDEQVYHLALRSEQLAPHCLLVGDPERAPFIAAQELSSVEHDILHRGLRSITGNTGAGQRMSIITTGMGTPSTEIVLGELAALNELDLVQRVPRSDWEPLRLIRVGTSGGLQAEKETPLGTLVISEYAVGLDNTGLFYERKQSEDPFLQELENAVRDAIRAAQSPESFSYGRIFPYASKAHPALVSALTAVCEDQQIPYKRGITVSNSGFFANQGRDIFRVRPAVPDIDQLLAELRFSNGLRIENMEMESSFIFHFATAMGYAAGAICPAIANRQANSFAGDIQSAVRDAARIATRALHSCF